MSILSNAIVGALSYCLPLRIKRALLHLSFRLAPSDFGEFAHRYCLAPSMRTALEALADRGLQPTAIIDVGAYEGEWSILAKQIWPKSKLFMVEPNRAKQQKLLEIARKLHGHLFATLLGANNGQEVQFNVMETGSSIMSERSSVERTSETRTLSTLDSLSIEPEGRSGLLKIDAQGYELEILKGASKTLASVEAILLEIAIIEINEQAPLLHDVISFMDKAGFAACELLEMHRRPLDQALSQIDVMFIRKDSPLFADKRFSA